MKILITIPNQGSVEDIEDLHSVINRMNGEIEFIPNFSCSRSVDLGAVIKQFQTNVIRDKSKSKYHK